MSQTRPTPPKCKNSHLLQTFIFMMNEFQVRNRIVEYYLKQSSCADRYEWFGTWVLRQQSPTKQLYFTECDPLFSLKSLRCQPHHLLCDFLRNNRSGFQSNTQRTIVFTACLLYDEHSVHFVTFLYNPAKKHLISFDPGVELYLHGQKTLVPHIQKAFHDATLLTGSTHKGACHQHYQFSKKKYGIQFNGKTMTDLPADAFCQSWTIFVLIRLFYQDPKETTIDRFLSNWCGIAPADREYFILSFFILDVLKHLPDICRTYMTMLRMPPRYKNVVLNEMMESLETCFFKARPVPVSVPLGNTVSLGLDRLLKNIQDPILRETIRTEIGRQTSRGPPQRRTKPRLTQGSKKT